MLEQQVEQLQNELRTLRARLHIYAQALDSVNDMVIIKDQRIAASVWQPGLS